MVAEFERLVFNKKLALFIIEDRVNHFVPKSTTRYLLCTKFVPITYI